MLKKVKNVTKIKKNLKKFFYIYGSDSDNVVPR